MGGLITVRSVVTVFGDEEKERLTGTALLDREPIRPRRGGTV